jgi:exodeoxyribonuclease VII small subunit
MGLDPEPHEAASSASPEQLDYESALADLDAVLVRLEDGQVALEEAMELYERGVRLVRRCSALLDGAERRVSELTAGPDGLPQDRPLRLENVDHDAGVADG